jgi:hypothetical protein
MTVRSGLQTPASQTPANRFVRSYGCAPLRRYLMVPGLNKADTSFAVAAAPSQG